MGLYVINGGMGLDWVNACVLMAFDGPNSSVLHIKLACFICYTVMQLCLVDSQYTTNI